MVDTFTRAVYAYYPPEVRAIIDGISSPYPHDVFLRSVSPGLDDFHLPIIEKYIEVYNEYMPGLSSFPCRYVSSGSSEALFHILSGIAARSERGPLYIVEGEYEGYAGYGRNLGLAFTTVPDGFDPSALAPGIFFISNPSSRDGNAHDRNVIRAIGDAGHQIVLDCAYVGMTAGKQFLVDHPSISAVVTSMSKPFGTYYYRSGFAFSRKPMPTLEVNKWFKNIFSLIIADRILSDLDPQIMYTKYKRVQHQILEELGSRHQIMLQPSEVYLLAHVYAEDISAEQKKMFKKFHRGGRYYRFGLTPEFLRREA